jgi:hypothetical protein
MGLTLISYFHYATPEKLGFRIEDDWLEPESALAFLENPKAAA